MFTYKCEYNEFTSKYTNINSLHETQIDILHNDLLVSYVKKGSLRVNSMMILVALSKHAELARATARGRSYCERGEFSSI